jgi:hypothetical protein
VFALPVELLSAQISNAVDLALTEPASHLELYYTLTWSPSITRGLRTVFTVFLSAESSSSGQEGGSLIEDLQKAMRSYMEGRGSLEEVTLKFQVFRRFLSVPSSESPLSQVITIMSDYLDPPQTPDDLRSFRASQQARATLDSIQVSVGGRWRRSIQAASVLLAAVAALLIELTQQSDSRWTFFIAGAIIGGPISWTIRDITAGVERWRR